MPFVLLRCKIDQSYLNFHGCETDFREDMPKTMVLRAVVFKLLKIVFSGREIFSLPAKLAGQIRTLLKIKRGLNFGGDIYESHLGSPVVTDSILFANNS